MPDDIDYVAQFQAYLLTEKRVSENTFAAYSTDIDQLDLFVKKQKLTFDTVQKRQLNSFLKGIRDQGIKAKTLSRKISSIKLFFTYLHDHYKLPNPAKSLIFPKLEKTLPNYLSEDEIQKLLLAANSDNSDKGIRNKVMLYVLYATGMRVSELVHLTVDQLHFDTGFVHLVGKGNKERVIPLPKNILELLRYYLDHIYHKLLGGNAHLQKASKSYLFAASYGHVVKPLSRQSFWMILKKILTKAMISKNISPHSLRHSLATHLLKNGADIRSLQLLLGHENIATVQVYTHLEKSQVRKVYDAKHPRA